MEGSPNLSSLYKLNLLNMKNIHINSFEVSVSIQSYNDKNTINWGWVRYQPKKITISEFAELIKQGYCFCHCFNTKGQEFGVKEKKDANFSHTNMVFFDIDDSDIDMSAFVSKLSRQPTISYTTPNNYTAKYNFKYRFRLCYLFDEAIEDVRQFETLYDSIEHIITNDTNTTFKDKCGRKPSQQFGGNGKDCELHITNTVYSLSDFPFQNNNVFFSSLLFSNGKTDEKKDSPKQAIKDVAITDYEFVYDINKMKATDLIEKYKTKYQYFTHTELNFQDGYAIIPTDYMEIYRSWYVDYIPKKNGDVCKASSVKKLRDGDGRRKKLFVAGLIRKKILPSITFEHLLYNLVCERFYYYDNSDKVLTNKELTRIAKEVINKPLEEIKLSSKEKRKFVVDRAYCLEHGISPNAMKNTVKKKLKDEEIGNHYDCSLSLKENLAAFKNMGIKVGKSRLYQWCKENNINTKGEKICERNLYEEFKFMQYGYFLSTSFADKQYYIKSAKEIAEEIWDNDNAA